MSDLDKSDDPQLEIDRSPHPTVRPPVQLLLWAGGAYVAWSLFVMASGAGWHLGPDWNFSTIGAMGDAFGGLNALMATLAALFTFQALMDERAETRRLRVKEERRDRDEVKRETERMARQNARDQFELEQAGALSTRRDEERQRDRELTFFRMLDLRRTILDDIETGTFKGIIALRRMTNSFTNQYDANTLQQYYNSIAEKHSTILNHYFRFTYHLVKFADENFPFNAAYGYVRLLRAQLSEPEQKLIGLNAIFGEGKDKMLPLIEKYALLHNISPEFRAFLLKMDLGITTDAFESPSARAS